MKSSFSNSSKSNKVKPGIMKETMPQSGELFEKKKRFQIKFEIDKDVLHKDDIVSVLKKINYPKINNDINNYAQMILSTLNKRNPDAHKTQITVDSLIEHICSNNNQPMKSTEAPSNDQFIFNKINEQLLGKSDLILLKWNKIKDKITKLNDTECLEDIEFIWNNIKDWNIQEIDKNDFQDKILNDSSSKKYMVKFSQLDNKELKEKDLKTVRMSKRFSISAMKNITNAVAAWNNNATTTSSSFKMSGNGTTSSQTSLNKSQTGQTINTNSSPRRSTNLSNFISPSIAARVYNQINKIDKFDFDIFSLDELVQKKTMIYIANEVFSKLEMINNDEIINEKVFTNFIKAITDGYSRANAWYHNDLHACDVFQTVYMIFMQCDIEEKWQLTELDTFSIYLSALCHDFRHTGQNNNYHINSRSKIAQRYNDLSVLENYHISQTFKVISNKETNIWENFSPEEYRICRQRIISGIWATDMTNHKKLLMKMDEKIKLFNIKRGKNFMKLVHWDDGVSLAKYFKNQQKIINIIIHCADISNAAKQAKLSQQWTKMVYDEFFKQGDWEREKGLPISLLCDRNTTNVNQVMIQFIKFVVAPSFEILTNLLPEVFFFWDNWKHNWKYYQDQYNKNIKEEEKK